MSYRLQSYAILFIPTILIYEDFFHFSLLPFTFFPYLCTMIPHFEIAIVDTNILTAMGLQQILSDIIPVGEIRTFISFDELQDAD